MSIWKDTDGFFVRNGKLHKTFPFRGRQSCEAKTERLLYFHFFLCPVLQGFQHTVLVQQLFACQIGHRAGHPQDTVMGAGGKAQSVVGGAQQPLGGRGHAADAPHLPGGERLLRASYDALGLSARAHDRILRVARTVADLAGKQLLDEDCVLEALQYRAQEKVEV